MIKINAKTLKDFIVKTTADGLVTDCKLDFTADGLSMIHKDPNGVILIAGILNKSEFQEYEIMSIELPSTSILIKSLSSFKESVINIVKNNNMVKIMDENGGLDLNTAEKLDCTKNQQGGDLQVPGLEYDNSILVKKSMIESIMTRNSIVGSDEIIVHNKDKKVSFNIGKETNKAESSAISSVEKELIAQFNIGFFGKITASMDPIVELSVGAQGIPSRFIENTAKYKIQYFITPISDEPTTVNSEESADEIKDESSS